MARKESMAFEVVASTDFSYGFNHGSFSWSVHTLSARSRSWEFSVPGCTGIKWSLVVGKNGPNSQTTTVGLHCRDAPVLVPAVFRITIYDGEGALLMNRSGYFTFGGSNGCGFTIENWTILERRLRFQTRPLTVYLLIDVAKDRSFLSEPISMPASFLLLRSHMDALRAEFHAIESPHHEPPPYSDITILVAKNIEEDRNGKAETSKDKLHCHRHVLCSHSAVFKRMLEKSNFVESSRGVIDKSEDVDRSTMIAMLRYMYCGEVGKEYEEFKVELDSIVRLLNVAEMYELAGLKAWCQSAMIVGYDTDEQRRRQLLVADIFDLKQLKAICVAQLSSDREKLDENLFKEIRVDGNVFEEIVRRQAEKNDAMCVELK